MYMHKLFKLVWNGWSAVSHPFFLRCRSQSLGWDPPPLHLRNVMKDMVSTWCKGKVHAGNLLYIVMGSVSTLLRRILSAAENSLSIILINSLYKISHRSCKTVPIFTTFTHNPKADLLNKHICYDLQKIARTYQTNKSGKSPAVCV